MASSLSWFLVTFINRAGDPVSRLCRLVLEFRAVEFIAGFPASGLDRSFRHPSRVVPELQSFFVFVVLARDTDRQSTALRAVVFRAMLAFVRIIRAFPELVALRKGQYNCPFFICQTMRIGASKDCPSG